MIKYVLFDLDGTLIHFDHTEFLSRYMHLLGNKVSSLTEPKLIVSHVMNATQQMIQNLDGTKTNAEVFWEHLNKNIDLPSEKLLPVLESFYTDDFNQLSYIAKETTAKQILHKLLQKNIPLILATNPLFPLKAVHSRLSWGKLHDIPFKLITSYETSHFCKPNIEYYQEIVEKLGCSPSECLMIGNDVKEDLIAGKLGIKTYLVTDTIINTENLAITADYSGSLLDLHSHIDSILA